MFLFLPPVTRQVKVKASYKASEGSRTLKETPQIDRRNVKVTCTVIGQFHKLKIYVKISDIILQFSGNLGKLIGMEIILSMTYMDILNYIASSYKMFTISII